jgi:hypothetical protein
MDEMLAVACAYRENAFTKTRHDFSGRGAEFSRAWCLELAAGRTGIRNMEEASGPLSFSRVAGLPLHQQAVAVELNLRMPKHQRKSLCT